MNLTNLLVNYPELKKVETAIYNAIELLVGVYSDGGKLLVCGNGGSAADCEHIVGELLKEFKIERKPSDEILHKLKKIGASEEYRNSVKEFLNQNKISTNSMEKVMSSIKQHKQELKNEGLENSYIELLSLYFHYLFLEVNHV